tara:strand:+ start:4728 stop:5564 length:837 start_codon:yes stop_codon:yes gene_type:complete
MKFKHNKKRNTAFLYESLLKEASKSVVKGDKDKKKKILSILKEFFSQGKILKRELDLYKFLYETRKVDPYTAERIIQEARKDYASLNLKEVFNAQTALINLVNKELGKDSFAAFVPNYRSLATISQIFNNEMTAKSRVLLERKIIGVMISSPKEQSRMTSMPKVDDLAYKTFIKKFNQKYGDDLLSEQRDLLTRYILSLSDNGVALKIFLNEELSRLKVSLAATAESEDFRNDELLQEKVAQVSKLLESFSQKRIDGSMIEKVLKIQSLIGETQADGD